MEAGQENFDLFEQVQMNAVVMVRDSGTGLLRPIEYDTEKGGIPLAVKFESAASFRSAVLPSYTSNALKFLRVNAGATDVEWATVTLTPGGSDKQLQFNDGGTAFGGATGLEWTKATGDLSLSPAGTMGITPTGVLTVNPTAASTINNCSIGATTAKTGRFTTVESTQAAGTPPFTVASNTLVSNLNADLLDGNEASAFAAAVHTHSYVSSVSGTSPIASSGGLTPAISLGVSAADKYLYSTALNTWTEGTITAAGRALLDDAAASNQCTTLGLGTLDSPSFAGVTLGNTGLHILDTNASHDLIIAPGSDLTADKTLTLTTGDADRTITLTGNPTLNDWFDQSVKQAAGPSFDHVHLTVAIGTAPLVVTSTTVCSNLNADLLDGNEASAFATSGHTHSYVSSVSGTSPIASSGGTTPAISLAVSAADKYLYSTALNTWTEGSITAAGRALLDDAAASNQCTTLGLGTLDSPSFAGITLGNTGLHILDTNASHDLIIAPGSDLTADKTLTLTTGDADRTITLSGNPTLADWFSQSVKTGASPYFAKIGIAETPVAYCHILGANTAASLTAAQADTARFIGASPGVALAIGIDGANTPYPAWLQVRSSNADGYSYPLALNPLGGKVAVGLTAPTSTMHVVGGNSVPSTTYNAADAMQITGTNPGVALAVGIDGSGSPYPVWLQARSSNASGSTYPILLNPMGGNVGINNTNPTSPLYCTGNAYFTADVSALTFTDRTPGFDKETSYRIAKSIACKDGQLDHNSLAPEIRRGEGRDLSGTVSALHMVIKNLLARVEALEAR